MVKQKRGSIIDHCRLKCKGWKGPPLMYSFIQGFHSLVLIWITYANYEFTFKSFGTNGCICNGGVLTCTDLYEELESKSLNIQQTEQYSNTTNMLCMCSLVTWNFHWRRIFWNLIMWKCEQMNDIPSIRLSWDPRVVENVFGIFCIFKTNINLQLLWCHAVHSIISCGKHQLSLTRHQNASIWRAQTMGLSYLDFELAMETWLTLTNSNKKFHRQSINEKRSVSLIFQTDRSIPWQNKFL
jgi:hypothetical protein